MQSVIPEILFITVNYKNTAITANFLTSLQQLDLGERSAVVIVDNESTTSSQESLRELCGKIDLDTKIISSPKNRYYWGGAAHALQTLGLDYDNRPNWIIVCNNDILFKQSDLLLKLCELDPEEYPVLAPTIISTNSMKNLNPYMVRPIKTMAKLYYAMFFFNSVTGLLIYKFRKFLKNLLFVLSNTQNEHGRTIYAPHGAFIIFSNVFFQKGGWLDDNLTMYGEEFTVAEIARRLQLPVHYRPDLEVMHVEHSSTKEQNWSQSFAAIKNAYYYVKREYL